MSNKVRCRVWENSNQCGAARLLLLALAEHANDDGVCWPSISRLAKYSNVSERQTQRILKKLVADGEVELTVRTGGRGKTQCFIIKGYTDGISRETTTVAVDTEQKTVTSAASAHASNGAPKGDIQRPNGDIPVPKADDSSGGKGDKAMSVKDGMAMSPEPKEPLLQPSKEPSVNPLPPKPPPLQQPVEEVVGSSQSTAAHLRTCAGSMLAELGVLPDTARALAGKYEYQIPA
ncbi:MAG: helix-turn-helix domain-containing protein [Anaerolineales bacterium]|nr:helix-turn-helix domain-containing protein [Anaerolineales bacterium]